MLKKVIDVAVLGMFSVIFNVAVFFLRQRKHA
jgi:hypothetical protein